jgi:hypothetical protein
MSPVGPNKKTGEADEYSPKEQVSHAICLPMPANRGSPAPALIFLGGAIRG